MPHAITAHLSPMEFYNLGAFKMIDGTPKVQTIKGRQFAYLSGFRPYEFDSRWLWGDGIGAFASQTDNLSPRGLEDGLIKKRDGRLKRVLKPYGFYRKTNFDYLIAPVGGFTRPNNERDLMYTVVQVEDHHTGARFNGEIWPVDDYPQTPVYGRVGMVYSPTGVNFRRMYHEYRDDFGVTREEWEAYGGRRGTPILEHFQPEYTTNAPGVKRHPITGEEITVKPPAGIKGLAATSAFAFKEYLYIFYTRMMDIREQNYDPAHANYPGYGFPPFLGSAVLPEDWSFGAPGPEDTKTWNEVFSRELKQHFSGICVARAKIDEITDPDYKYSANPFKKYYRKRKPGDYPRTWTGKVDWDNENERWFYRDRPEWEVEWTDGYRGLDTVITPAPASYCEVAWCEALNRFVMVAQGPGFNGVRVFFSAKGYHEDSLVNWDRQYIDLPVHSPAYYPTLLNVVEGSNHNISDTCWLYYLTKIENNHDVLTMVRQPLKFQQPAEGS